MNVLVTGGCGQLGMSLRRVMADAIFTDVVDAPDTVLLDITDLAAVRSMVASEGVDVIVNCAGYTNVDAAESHADAADLLNAKAVENLAVAMKEVGGLLVHISTDYVFGSKYNTPIPEDTIPAPESVYGQSKWHGEEAIRRVGCRSVIIRTAWLYSEFGKNFVKTMLRLTAEKPSLKVVFDQVGTPTYAGDLAEAIVEIAGQAGNDAPRHAQAEATSPTKASAPGTTLPKPSRNTPAIPPATSSLATATSSPRRCIGPPIPSLTKPKLKRLLAFGFRTGPIR